MIKRRHFIIAGSILIITLILGSFFDFSINQALFDRYNGFGVFMAAVGLTPGYGLIAFLSGILFYIARKQNFNKGSETVIKILRISLIVLSFVGVGVTAYFTGEDIFSVNGYDIVIADSDTVTTIIATLIAAVPSVGFFFLGNWLGRNVKSEKAWIAILILIVAIIIALVPGVTLFKSIFHRPRYRFVVFDDNSLFHNWWSPYADYKSNIGKTFAGRLLTEANYNEEFKSFPSGHTAVSMLVPFFLTFLTICCPKLEKYKTPLFYTGYAYGLLIAYTRMRVGAHYLSDVSMGGLITILFMFIANEFIIRYKLLEFQEKTREENTSTEEVMEQPSK